MRAEEVEGAVWASVLELLADPRRLMAQAAEHLGLLEGAAGVERDALVRAQVEVERRQQALVDATATGLQAGLDSDTLRQVVTRLRRDLAEARRARAHGRCDAGPDRRAGRAGVAGAASRSWRRTGWPRPTVRCSSRCWRCWTCA